MGETQPEPGSDPAAPNHRAEAPFFATTARGMEGLLATELERLGLQAVRESRAGVHFGGSIEAAYRVCLYSRLASRVLLILARGEIRSAEELASLAHSVPWTEHAYVERTFAVDAVAHGSALRDSRYAALLIKDALVDALRDAYGERPNVDRRHPDLRLSLNLIGARAILAIDLSGESLHRRGWRGPAGPAPLKENLACALLLRSGWTPDSEGLLVDPLCGSGTILIEAAQMAGDHAPGLGRDRFGFHGWRGHAPALWKSLLREARARTAAAPKATDAVFIGYDRDPRAIDQACENAERAGVAAQVHFECRELSKSAPPVGTRFVVCNPPYGERLAGSAELVRTYADLGAFLRRSAEPLRATVLTGAPETLSQLRMSADRRRTLYNGALPCVVATYEIYGQNRQTEATALPDPPDSSPHGVELSKAEPNQAKPRAAPARGTISLSQPATEFRNRLAKNARRIVKWAKREGLQAFRVYDADLPAYNAALDVYGEHLVVYEYRAPASVDPDKARDRMQDILLTAPEVLGIAPERVIVKERRRTRGADQYQKQAERGRELRVREYDLQFLVNLYDYLDTGLFPDHRLVRRELRGRSSGRQFLNLYGYTGTASVAAAAGGATRSVTVDLSRSYLDWAGRNLTEQGCRLSEHQLVREDCAEYLRSTKERFDLVFVNPPSFSRSKRMQGTFDIVRDHAELLLEVRRVLSPRGEVCFSTNRRNFELDRAALEGAYSIRDISKATLPLDFSRSTKQHHVWLLGPLT